MTAPSSVLSAHLLATLCELGVERVFLAPGSRSQSLAIAASALHDAGKLYLSVIVDERSMAFNALGVAKATGRPVVLITTSGTAVANLHPAVLEAHHSSLPLILLTADRPAKLRGLGANQTTNQVGIFSDAVRICLDITDTETSKEQAIELGKLAFETASGIQQLQPGPVQLNLCFSEPLSSPSPSATDIFPKVELAKKQPTVPSFATLDGSKKTVVVAGADAGFEALEAAEAFGWPIFAEPSSQSRVGANAIIGYPKLLTDQEQLSSQIERVIVYGKPTLSRAVQTMIARKNIELGVIKSPSMGLFNPSGNASWIADELTVDGEVDSEWLVRWRVASHNWLAAQSRQELDRRSIIEAVYNRSEFDDAIFLAASRMIREADIWAPAKAVRVFANRGLSGIDGSIATAIGIASCSSGAFTRAIVGDLALLHDAGSLAHDKSERLNLQLVVANDFGGSIFDTLEVASQVDTNTFDRVFRTPQQVDLWSLANAYGYQYQAPTTEAELSEALLLPNRVLIDIKL